MRWIEPSAPLPGARAITTTRNGGVSAAPYTDWNLAAHVGDAVDAVAENRRRLLAATGCAAVQWLDQVHGTTCVHATSTTARDVPEADAAWTTERGLALAVLTADCVPVVVSEAGGPAIGVAHAGWRGLVDGVLEALLDDMPAPRANLHAWLGPAIGPAHYEIGSDVADRVARGLPTSAGRKACLAAGARGKYRLDLFALATVRLEAAGVASIGCERLDTFADPRFYSYRRESVTGRMATLIWRS